MSLRERAKKMREDRCKLVKDARALLDKDDATDEDLTKADELLTASDKLEAKIKTVERQMAAEDDLEQRIEARAGAEDISIDEATARTKDETETYKTWMRYGMANLTPTQRAEMAKRQGQLPEGIQPQAAQSTTTGSEGGYLIPSELGTQLEQAMEQYSGVRQSSATVIRTSTGAPLSMPTSNDASEEGELVGESQVHSEGDVAFGAVNFGAHTYSSKMVRVPVQLLQDSAFDLFAYLSDILGRRIGRVTNRHFTTGTGAGAQPSGLLTGATLGKTGATGQVDSVTPEDLMDLEHSVDPDYRGSAEWMFHDTTLRVLKGLKDNQGRYLWLPGLAVQAPDTVLGYPYAINKHMPEMAASAKSIAFGAMSKYTIRDVLGVTVLRLGERFAEYLQVAFLAYSRHDGHLIDAGTNPIKYYQHPAS